MKLACFSLTAAPPIRNPRSPALSINSQSEHVWRVRLTARVGEAHLTAQGNSTVAYRPGSGTLKQNDLVGRNSNSDCRVKAPIVELSQGSIPRCSLDGGVQFSFFCWGQLHGDDCYGFHFLGWRLPLSTTSTG